MTLRSITREEIPLLGDLFARAFRFDVNDIVEPLTEDRFRYPYSSGYIWEEADRGAVAGMVLFQRNMSLHGGELPAGLIGLVSVPPDQRRRGYANKLLVSGLEKMRSEHLPISLLFPYSIPFYNRLGYGIASEVWSLELPLGEMMDFDDFYLSRRMTVEDLPAMERLYDRVRQRRNGWLNRTGWEWRERVLDLQGRAEWPQKVEGVVVPGEGGELRAYLTYTLSSVGQDGKQRALSVREWVSEDEASWRALAGFVSAQRAQAEFVRYTAPRGFPLYHALRERNTFRDRRDTEFAFRDTLSQGAGLMARLIHVEQALKQRRYPAGVQGECVVQVRDKQLPANEEPLHFHVADGRAAVAPARHKEQGVPPTATADVRTWSEMYAGTLLPADARLLGRLEADDETVAFLTAAFAGEPWFLPRADWF